MESIPSVCPSHTKDHSMRQRKCIVKGFALNPGKGRADIANMTELDLASLCKGLTEPCTYSCQNIIRDLRDPQLDHQCLFTLSDFDKQDYQNLRSKLEKLNQQSTEISNGKPAPAKNPRARSANPEPVKGHYDFNVAYPEFDIDIYSDEYEDVSPEKYESSLDIEDDEMEIEEPSAYKSQPQHQTGSDD